MAWIKTINPDDAEEPLRTLWQQTRDLYPPEYAVAVEGLNEAEGGGITQAHSLIPQVLFHGMGLLGAALSPDLPLQRRQHEMIATVVSAVNRCFY